MASTRKKRLLTAVPIIAAIVVLMVARTHRDHVRSAAVTDESSKVTAEVRDTAEFIPERVSRTSTAGEREAENPMDALKSRFTWKKTLFRKAAVSGYIRNTARSTQFGHIQARLEVLDENARIISTEDLVIGEELLPGDSVKVKLKSDDRFKNLQEVRLVVTSAVPKRI